MSEQNKSVLDLLFNRMEEKFNDLKSLIVEIKGDLKEAKKNTDHQIAEVRKEIQRIDEHYDQRVSKLENAYIRAGAVWGVVVVAVGFLLNKFL
jgi:predicted  nucleic acid-binding Zn-ribbon protein